MDAGELVVWRKDELEKQRTIAISIQSLLSIALGPKHIFVGGSYDETFIAAVDRSSFQKSFILKEHSGSVFSLYHHNDKLISGSADDIVFV